MSQATPSTEEQRLFWDEWNQSFRERGVDAFMQRQMDVALESVPEKTGRPLRILEVGCGNGWLSNALSAAGEVTAIDLSPRSIERAQELYPQIRFLAGDFKELETDKPFDYVVSADVIAHVADQDAFIESCAQLLAPGGRFLLMTQNPFVWNRSSYLEPQKEGQLRNWPSLGKLRELMQPFFEITCSSSIVPGGDQGILKVANHPAVLRILRTLLGWRRSTALYERMLVGRELTLIAQRRRP